MNRWGTPSAFIFVRWVGVGWQALALVIFVFALTGNVKTLPAWGKPGAEYEVVALVASGITFAVLFYPYKGDIGRKFKIWTRMLAWDLTVGSVLVFTIAVASTNPDGVVSGVAGVYLLFNGAFFLVSYFASEAHEHDAQETARIRREVQHQELLDAVQALSADAVRRPKVWSYWRSRASRLPREALNEGFGEDGKGLSAKP
jgi:hypothetical protein